MVTHKLLVGALAVSAVFGAAAAAGDQARPSPVFRQLPVALVCLHDSRSVAADRARRDGAINLARAINEAQATAVQATRRYQPLSALPDLPVTPRGFELRFYTNGEGYILSVKDTLDPCRYGLFTDQHGRLYEMSPQVPQIAG